MEWTSRSNLQMHWMHSSFKPQFASVSSVTAQTFDPKKGKSVWFQKVSAMISWKEDFLDRWMVVQITLGSSKYFFSGTLSSYESVHCPWKKSIKRHVQPIHLCSLFFIYTAISTHVQYAQTDTIRQTDGPLVPMVGLVPIEKDVIPMVLLVNMHLIKGT